MASEVVSWKLWNNALPILLYGSLAVQIKIDFYLKDMYQLPFQMFSRAFRTHCTNGLNHTLLFTYFKCLFQFYEVF